MNLMPIGTPSDTSAQGKLEACERAHDDRVDVLGMKARIAQKLGIVVLRLLLRVLQLEWIFVGPVAQCTEFCLLVKDIARGVIVDDIDTISARAGRQLLGRDLNLGG